MIGIDASRSLLRAALGVVCVLVFVRVIAFPFVTWDDEGNIYKNPYLSPPAELQLGRFWTAPYDGLYIPVTYTLWALVVRASALGGRADWQRSAAALCHLTNLALHAAAALVVFAIVLRLVRQPAAAFVGAALFAVHPLQVEAVAWATGLKDVLGGCLLLVALDRFLALAEAASGRTARRRALGASAAYAASLLAKPSAVVAPALAALLWVHERTSDPGRERRPSRPWALLALWAALALPIVLVNRTAQPASAPAGVSPWWRLLVVGDTTSFYLAKLLVPTSLTIDYGRSPQQVLGQWWIILTGLLPYGLFAVAWRLRARQPWMLLTLGVFLIAILPVSGIVPFGFQRTSTVADRYVYVAMLGPALGAGFLLRAAGRGGRGAPWVVAGLLLSLLAIRSGLQVGAWASTATLFQHAMAVNPQSRKAHDGFGRALFDAGRLDEFIAHYQERLWRDGIDIELGLDLGVALVSRGRLDEARALYEELAARNPRRPEPQIGLAVVLGREGERAAAIAHYERALAIDPDNADANAALGAIALVGGDHEAAIGRTRRALAARPASAAWHYQLGVALVEAGRRGEASAELRAALELDPRSAAAANDLAWILATSRDSGLRDAGRAVELAERALALGTADRTSVLDTLAASYAEAGRFDEAMATVRAAIDRAAADERPGLERRLRERLALYERRQPLRDPAQ